MLGRKKNNLMLLAILVVLALSTGCTTTLRNKQLEKVSKDWALVIRASQVIPVYPLTEDMQPGDVLLVSMPIEEQVKIYKDKGFLPLDQHLTRFESKDYSKFYNCRYGVEKDSVPPKMWQVVDDAGKTKWENAPHAAFPAYNFTVDTSSGLNLAIPIQSVPFALGLMNAGKASGSVTISDAYTYGLDIFGLQNMVQEWAKKNRNFLRHYEPRDGRQQFLRVVSRVYVTGKVNVTVKNDEAKGGEFGVGAGTDSPIKLMGLQESSSSANYTKLIEQINSLAGQQLPGVGVKIATATSRSVTLNETFKKPLVIGYVGFDMPILKGGWLGAPISTLEQLSGQQAPPAGAIDSGSIYHLAALSHMHRTLKSIESEKAQDIRARLDALEQIVPRKYPFTLYIPTEGNKINKNLNIIVGASTEVKEDRVRVDGFELVLYYFGNAETTVKTLEVYLKAHADSNLEQNLKAARESFDKINDSLSHEPALMEAVDLVFFGN